MKTLIIYYSFSGNNRILAEETALRLGAETMEIKEVGTRSEKRIVLDMIFHRYPKIHFEPDLVSEYDLVLFFSPIWMFGIASPLRTCFKLTRSRIKNYGFVSLSGGALGPNTKISKELVRRLGKNQVLMLDLSIANFMMNGREKDAKATSAFQLEKNPKVLNSLSSIVSASVNALQI